MYDPMYETIPAFEQATGLRVEISTSASRRSPRGPPVFVGRTPLATRLP